MVLGQLHKRGAYLAFAGDTMHLLFNSNDPASAAVSWRLLGRPPGQPPGVRTKIGSGALSVVTVGDLS